MKLLKSILIVGILAIVAVGGYGYHSYTQNIKPVSDKEELISFQVESGSSVGSVITQLKENKLINDELMTKIYTKLNHITSLQANDYLLSPSYDLEKIFDILQNGTFEYLQQSSMTIIEGSNLKEIAAVLAGELHLTEEEVINGLNDPQMIEELKQEYPMLTDDISKEGIKYPLEGYLFPETYNLTNVAGDLKTYIKLLLDPMQNFINEHAGEIAARNMSVHEFLSFCSVVESESLFAEDKNMIAGVFYNRLKINMPLGSDVTVLYALDKQTVNVTFDDLKVDSPYNTYIYQGVPIGPICNASLSTMEACLNPTESSYLFFFACEDGKVLYSNTYEEHLQKAAENKWY